MVLAITNSEKTFEKKSSSHGYASAKVDSRILVTNKEIENELANQEFQNDETEYRLGHILISVPEAATPEKIAQVKQIAEGVLKDLSDGGGFLPVWQQSFHTGAKPLRVEI